MTKRYTLENKPNFNYGDMVKVDMSVVIGDDNLGVLPGKVVGKGITHIIDIWLIEFDKIFDESYPYKVCSVIHTSIIDETK